MKEDEDLLGRALALLPHGPGFRFVDRLARLEPGQAGEGEYRVSGDEAFLAGHFPGEPIFPGVLLVEAVAQLAGVVAQSDPNLTPLRNLKLTALQSVKILGTARPGQILRLEARVKGRMGNLIQAEGKAWVEEVLVLAASLTLSGTL